MISRLKKQRSANFGTRFDQHSDTRLDQGRRVCKVLVRISIITMPRRSSRRMQLGNAARLHLIWPQFRALSSR